MANVTIFDRLKKDHDTHRELLTKIKGARGDAKLREKLFNAFKIEVTAHAAAEEETLYATMLAQPDLREDAQHSVSEHKEIDDFFEELADLKFDGAAWNEKFDKLRKRYLHHIDEEEDEMFRDAAKQLSADEEKTLAALFARRKPAELERAEAAE